MKKQSKEVSGESSYRIMRRSNGSRPIEEVFAFFGDARNLESITPAWLRFSILTPSPIVMDVGTTIDYRLAWHHIPLRWTSLIETWDPPGRFVDRQIRGPYRLWHHTHTFEERTHGTLIRDEVCYQIPLRWLGALMHRLRIRRDLEAVFDFRTQRVRALLEPGKAITR